MLTEDEARKRIAPEGMVWICGACGKTAKDRYGIEGEHSAGWDESCMLNSVLVNETDLPMIRRYCASRDVVCPLSPPQVSELLSEIERLSADLTAARAEIERLREVLRIDGEQHAKAIRQARRDQQARLDVYKAALATVKQERDEARAALRARGSSDA